MSHIYLRPLLVAAVVVSATFSTSSAVRAQMIEQWPLPVGYVDVLATGHYKGGTAIGILMNTQEPIGPPLTTPSVVLVDATTGSVVWTYTPGIPIYVDISGPALNLGFRDGDGDGVDELYLFTTWSVPTGNAHVLHCFRFDFATSTLDPGAPQKPPTAPAKGFAVGPSTPNPASRVVQFAVSVPGPGPVDVTVLDVAGRIVRTLHHAADKAGDLTLSWDGQDRDGRPVASGAYYYRVRTTAGETTRTMIWIR